MIWILIAGLLLFLVLQTLVFRIGWQKGLTVSVKFLDTYVYEGDSSKLQETVVNRKWLPISALEVSMAMSRNLQFAGEAAENTINTDQSYKRDLFSFLFHEKITRTLDFVATKRGHYTISEVDLNVYDYLYRSAGFAMLPQNTELYVYPAQVDTRRLNIVCTAISGMLPVNNALFPDPFEFSGIREYVPTDPMNRINWKSTARQGKWMVNQFDSTTNYDPILVLDLEDAGIWRQEKLIEESIRIVSSLAARFLTKRMPLQLVSNAGIWESFAAGSGQITQINRMLACVGEARQTGIALLAELEPELMQTKSAGNGRICILVSKNNRPELIERVGVMANAATPFLWIFPRMSNEEEWQPNLAHVRVLNWEVKV